MKNLILLFILLTAFSCRDKEINDEFNVENAGRCLRVMNLTTPVNDDHTGTTVKIEWKTRKSSNYYKIYLKKNGNITEIEEKIYDNKYTLHGLDENTIYHVKIVEIVREVNKPNFIWSNSFWTKFTTDNLGGSGIVLKKHHIETQLPSYVNIMFQATNPSGKGISDLKTEDFVVLENNKKVSPTESAIKIKKKGTIPYSLKTVLLLDNSRSVGNSLAEIKNSAIALIDNIELGQEIAIYKFSQDPIIIQDFTSNKERLKTAVNSVKLGYNRTNLYGSIIEAVSRWEDKYTTNEIQQGFLIVLTDGSDTEGSSTKTQAIKARGNRKVYTIGLGNEINRDILSEIGNSGFYSITDISKLTQKFKDIQAEISQYANSFYWLNYMSPKGGNHKHTLKLYVKNNQNSKTNAFITGEFNSKGFYGVLEGIYINDDKNNKEGLRKKYLSPNESFVLKAHTFLKPNNPHYEWSSSNSSVISITKDETDNSRITINAIGKHGETAIIRVKDVPNDVEKSINIQIFHL